MGVLVGIMDLQRSEEARIQPERLGKGGSHDGLGQLSAVQEEAAVDYMAGKRTLLFGDGIQPLDASESLH